MSSLETLGFAKRIFNFLLFRQWRASVTMGELSTRLESPDMDPIIFGEYFLCFHPAKGEFPISFVKQYSPVVTDQDSSRVFFI